MAHIFSKVVGSRFLDLWYHFAIMFEALFILTTIDAGTRVGRYLLQDFLGHLWKPLGDTKSMPANFFASVLLVIGWGYFLVQGVRDPLGGINSLWPLFGIANQLLAGIALCLATTIILKMQLNPPPASEENPKPAPGRPIYALVTLIPLVWLMTVTMTSGIQKVFHSNPKIGFLSQAKVLNDKLSVLQTAADAAKTLGDAKAIEAATKALKTNRVLHFNMMLDAVVTTGFLVMVSIILLMCIREWILLIARKKLAQLQESAPVWLPAYAVAEGKPLNLFGLFALGLAMLREVSGEAAIDRAQQASTVCTPMIEAGQPARRIQVDLMAGEITREPISRSDAYVQAAEARFQEPNRCC